MSERFSEEDRDWLTALAVSPAAPTTDLTAHGRKAIGRALCEIDALRKRAEEEPRPWASTSLIAAAESERDTARQEVERLRSALQTVIEAAAIWSVSDGHQLHCEQTLSVARAALDQGREG